MYIDTVWQNDLSDNIHKPSEICIIILRVLLSSTQNRDTGDYQDMSRSPLIMKRYSLLKYQADFIFTPWFT